MIASNSLNFSLGQKNKGGMMPPFSSTYFKVDRDLILIIIKILFKVHSIFLFLFLYFSNITQIAL